MAMTHWFSLRILEYVKVQGHSDLENEIHVRSKSLNLHVLSLGKP